jgi:hypothetical protein
MDPEKIKAVIAALTEGNGDAALALLEEMLVAAASDGSASEETPPAESSALAETAETPPADGEDPDKDKAALARLFKLAGRDSLEGVAELFAKFAKRIEDDEATRSRVERDERRDLVAALVKCGAEIPATAWSGKPEDRNPAEPWASMPIAALRERVAKFSKTPRSRNQEPPPSGDDGDPIAQLSKAEQDAAAKIKDPAQRARFVELRLSRKGNTNG